jgi:hypothetical protein
MISCCRKQPPEPPEPIGRDSLKPIEKTAAVLYKVRPTIFGYDHRRVRGTNDQRKARADLH